MLPTSIQSSLKPPSGRLGAWLAAQRLRRARIKRMKRLRWRHRLKRLARATLATVAILFAALGAGLFGHGIGIEGMLATIFAMAVTFLLLLIFPRPHASAVHDLRGARFAALAHVSENWLEMQRGRLPTSAHGQLDQLGASLEHLAPQLANLDESEPVAREIRGLLADHLPTIVESYARIPQAHRHQPDAAGVTPEGHLTSGLAIIAREIDTVTGQIARGEFDRLAIRGRYLETKYQGVMEGDGA